ncbi:diacylglycerol/lipid kinase family protein [Gracilibacillus marinus]|uniref:Diacylglycerol/lipid kinase family protein n=1 Tax=Gracilibacillus marinus TaxID=630535 RepID=A0ABV8VVG1_9BACI
MKKATIILNPSSGKENSETYLSFVERIVKENAYTYEVKKTKRAGDAIRFAEQACANKDDLLIIMGGDGTVNEVINGVAEKEHIPLLHVIPLGTVNNFARALNIPLQIDEAIECIASTDYKSCDIGKINNQYFMNLVNVGAIAEATYSVTTEQKSKLGSFAYFIEGIKQFGEDAIFHAKLEIEDQTIESDTMLLLIAVTDTFASWKNVIKEAKIDDGYLHIFVFQPFTKLGAMSIVTKLMNGALHEHEQVTYYKTKKAIIHTDHTKTANIDGDEGCVTPLDVEILPKHVTVIGK